MNRPGMDTTARTTEDMVHIPGGRFIMGSDRFYPEEQPVGPVEVSEFLIDRYPVTNAQFALFITATGYQTFAERPKPHPHIPGHIIEPCSAVFIQPLPEAILRGPESWWKLVPGACWKHPSGPDSSIAGLEEHPVVHIAFEDALVYAEWIGKSLPNEQEWEFAARGGLEGAEFSWGDELMLDGKHMANTWQGKFPFVNTFDDGFTRTSPVDSFPANGYGVHDMIGNVWEWTTDEYAAQRVPQAKSCCRKSRRGLQQVKVIKGGSYLCAPNYCQRYRPAARHSQETDLTAGHIGFRCIVRLRSN